MIVRRAASIGAAAIVAALQVTGAAAPAQDPLTSIAWLSGCWAARGPDSQVDEHWMAPAGGAMLGMSRTCRGGATVDFEAMRIEARGGALVFIAKPARQPEAEFTSIEITPDRVVFENKSHDFPQRVIYRRTPDGTLAARIEGMRDGVAKGIDFPMEPAACPSSRR